MPGNEELLELYRMMLRIRKVERRIEHEYKYDEMKTPIHLSIGQEAIAAGVCKQLERKDYIFGTHRSHAQYLAKGGDLNKMIAELYLRKTGCSSGRGGSMHLIDTEAGVMGSSAILGGNIPLGTGTALASKMTGDGRVTVVFFGDGAADEGAFYESLNFASLKKLPVLYVCENNYYAINSPQSNRQPEDNVHERAKSFGMPGFRIDGNDVLQVYECAGKAIAGCRSGEGPALIECLTYRWKGHIGTVNDVGTGYRPQAEYDYWLSKCPIKWYSDYLKNIGVLDEKIDAAINAEIDSSIEEAFEFARSSPKPEKNELMEHVYA